MKTDRELNALMLLLDDPDNDVYDTVASKILDYGRSAIPTLEQFWEVSASEDLQSRIEDLIHRVNFQDLEFEFAEWAKSPTPELLHGAILVAKYHYPQLKVPEILTQLEQVRRNIWLEINNYLSPLEQVNVFNSIIYNYYKMQGHELTEREPKYFFINNLLEGKNGNPYTIGILYLSVCEMLDIPIFAVDIPRQFIFAYIQVLPNIFLSTEGQYNKVQFFIDPINGMVYSQNDVEVYLNKINATEKDRYYAPISNKRIIYKLLEELCLCYNYRKEEQKADDIRQLMRLIAYDKTEV